MPGVLKHKNEIHAWKTRSAWNLVINFRRRSHKHEQTHRTSPISDPLPNKKYLCGCPRKYSGAKLYTPPPSPPPFLLIRHFLGEGGWGCIFWGPTRQEFYMPPPFIRPPPLGGSFQGWGGACIKFGPVNMIKIAFRRCVREEDHRVLRGAAPRGVKF